ncbi:hypothetical protein KW786_01620 [Candidatus Parcubacteria bacterium]|nr:hypothetical protein [Candidatus Parcubacteria bacterium]
MVKRKSMKKIIAQIAMMAILAAPLASALPMSASAVTPTWDASGTYVINMNYLGTDYPHDMVLTMDNMGNLTGHGGSPAGANVYMWTINSGTVSGNTINFTAHYTATADAVTPQTVLHMTGTIGTDGSMSGTWFDNYQASQRSGTWMTTSGNAQEIPPTPESVKVTIVKYVNGMAATAANTNSATFTMNATWNATNIGSGSGQFTLSPTGFNSPTPYQAVTADMTSGGSYSTSEVMNSTTGAQCPAQGTEGGVPFMLMGYSTGNTLAQAQAAAPTMTPPSFTNLMSDKYVIVWNMPCDGTTGGIGGDVVQDNGMLHVDSITVVNGSATANGTFASGWKYIFHITDPTNEPNLAMKFADWMSGANMIPVANNMRISSAQANNGGATILLTAANTYSTPPLVMTTDLDPGMAGRQVDVTVEVSIPTGTPTGSYTTTYGVQSTP